MKTEQLDKKKGRNEPQSSQILHSGNMFKVMKLNMTFT